MDRPGRQTRSCARRDAAKHATIATPGRKCRAIAATGTLSLLVVAACSGALESPPLVAQPQSALVEVPYPPPPARVEIIPDSPAEGAAWTDGEWLWQGRRWAWRYGRWVAPPEGAAFSPSTTTRRTDAALFYAPGTWRDAAGAALPEPKTLARGKAREGDVVEPEGDLEQTAPNQDVERETTP